MTVNIHRRFFKAFSNNTRMEIIKLLRRGPLTVSELSTALSFEQSRVSHNLKCLENCGFVSVEQSGKWRKYGLDKETIIPIINLFDKHMEKYKERLEQCKVS